MHVKIEIAVSVVLVLFVVQLPESCNGGFGDIAKFAGVVGAGIKGAQSYATEVAAESEKANKNIKGVKSSGDKGKVSVRENSEDDDDDDDGPDFMDEVGEKMSKLAHTLKIDRLLPGSKQNKARQIKHDLKYNKDLLELLPDQSSAPRRLFDCIKPQSRASKWSDGTNSGMSRIKEKIGTIERRMDWLEDDLATAMRQWRRHSMPAYVYKLTMDKDKDMDQLYVRALEYEHLDVVVKSFETHMRSLETYRYMLNSYGRTWYKGFDNEYRLDEDQKRTLYITKVYIEWLAQSLIQRLVCENEIKLTFLFLQANSRPNSEMMSKVRQMQLFVNSYFVEIRVNMEEAQKLLDNIQPTEEEKRTIAQEFERIMVRLKADVTRNILWQAPQDLREKLIALRGFLQYHKLLYSDTLLERMRDQCDREAEELIDIDDFVKHRETAF